MLFCNVIKNMNEMNSNILTWKEWIIIEYFLCLIYCYLLSVTMLYFSSSISHLLISLKFLHCLYRLWMCLCCLKGIYVTRITPGGPAHEAGLRMGDKIMQVCSEAAFRSRSTRWHHEYTRESDMSCAHLLLIHLTTVQSSWC